MIVQAYLQDESPLIWDNATELRHQRKDAKDHIESVRNGIEDFPDGAFVHSVVDNDVDIVKCVYWRDRLTHDMYVLYSQGSVFILNDEGKTIARV